MAGDSGEVSFGDAYRGQGIGQGQDTFLGDAGLVPAGEQWIGLADTSQEHVPDTWFVGGDELGG
ncbi:hypothetical protein ACQX0D_11280 [Corynebacterium diphtheriae]